MNHTSRYGKHRQTAATTHTMHCSLAAVFPQASIAERGTCRQPGTRIPCSIMQARLLHCRLVDKGCRNTKYVAPMENRCLLDVARPLAQCVGQSTSNSKAPTINTRSSYDRCRQQFCWLCATTSPNKVNTSCQRRCTLFVHVCA